MRGIPQKYIGGLKTIVVRESTTLNHKRRRSKTYLRKVKVKIKECLGLYHQKWNREPAWIELFIDNIYDGVPKFVLFIPFFRELILAQVLHHEIGHHIHYTKIPEFKEKEDVAEKWTGKLFNYYFWHTYWYILGPLYPFLKIYKYRRKIRVR